MKGSLIFLAILLAGCADKPHIPTPDKYEDSPFVGFWLGQRIEDGEKLNWLVDRRASGEFTVTFLSCFNGRPKWYQEEYGTWEQSGENYTTRTEFMSDGVRQWLPDTPDKIYLEEYVVDSITETEFRYHHKYKPKSYVTKRVTRSYEISCSNFFWEVD
jgi:hypothetical protein